MAKKNKARVLFVCLGNICRSPTAQGMFEKLALEYADAIEVEADSAGTAAYHVGQAPDSRSQEAARQRGVDLSAQRARQVTAHDYDRFDLLLAMDESNHSELLRRAPAGRNDRVQLFMSYAPHMETSEVPDPYYGGPDGFDSVLDLVEEAGRGLLDKLTRA